MSRAAAVPIADGVWRIPTSIGDFVNSYAFRDADGTHAHSDHVGDLDLEVAAFTQGPEIRSGARDAVRAFLRGRER